MISVPLVILLVWPLGIGIFTMENITERFSPKSERGPKKKKKSKYSLKDGLSSETL